MTGTDTVPHRLAPLSRFAPVPCFAPWRWPASDGARIVAILRAKGCGS